MTLATADKLMKNAAKYPVAASFGNATKWDALDKAAAPASESNVKESPTTGTDP